MVLQIMPVNGSENCIASSGGFDGRNSHRTVDQLVEALQFVWKINKSAQYPERYFVHRRGGPP